MSIKQISVNMKKATFIQVGLLSTCEYSYLATGASPPRSIHEIPVKADNWDYFGVEVNPFFISNLLEYNKHRNVNIICAGISEESKLIRVDEASNIILVPCITLNNFIDELILNHNVENIGGIYLDIEGAEYNIIKNYEFKHKPPFFGVEVHGREVNPGISKRSYSERGEDIKEIFFKNGYKLHLEKVTNANRTLELQFIL